MKAVIWFLVAVLIVIHQDIWFWEDGTLVFGFMPIGLFYHVCISLAAASVWLLATLTTWPAEVDFDAEHEATSKGSSSSAAVENRS